MSDDSAPPTVLRVHSLRQLVGRIQSYTKEWPAPLRYTRNAEIGATDTDQGFERLLRESLDDALMPGQVSGIRDMGMGDDLVPAIVPRHELDLMLGCEEGRFVVEAKAWQGEVGKEAVIVFLAKILDFMAATGFEPVTPIFAGFIALTSFSDAALRIIFTCGLIPLTKSADQLAFHYVDTLLEAAAKKCQTRDWPEQEQLLRKHRAQLTPYLAQEGKSISRTFLVDQDSMLVDLEGIRRSSEMFDEARTAHRNAMNCYRQFTEALNRA